MDILFVIVVVIMIGIVGVSAMCGIYYLWHKRELEKESNEV